MKMKIDPGENGGNYISILDFDLEPVSQTIDVVLPTYPLMSLYYFRKEERFDVFRSVVYLQINGEDKGILLDKMLNMYIEVTHQWIKFYPRRYILVGNLRQLNVENIKGVVKDYNDKGWWVDFYEITEWQKVTMGIPEKLKEVAE